MKNSSDKRRQLSSIVLFACLFNFLPAATGIDASLDYEVDGDGFHRTIRYRVDTGNFFSDNCYLAIHLSPNPTLYVNIDELADRQRLGETMACSEGEIDVELFAEKAKRQNITVCAPLKESDNILNLPVHQRYQLPRRNEEFVKVKLPEPVLLLGCKERIKEHPVSKIDLCSPCVDLSRKWRQIPYKTKTEPYVWSVPVGNLSDLEHITQITLFTVIFGTIMILKTLWFSKGDKREKGD